MTVPDSSRRRIVLLVAASAVVLASAAIWEVWGEPLSLEDRAKQIEVGWHITEVEELLGRPGYVQPVGKRKEIWMYGVLHEAWMKSAQGIEAVSGDSLAQPAIQEFPVVVYYDPRSGRVFRIKRGEEMVGTPHSPW